MSHDLITLADLPALAAGKKPTSTIVVARLDDKLKDPRYGRFAITQADVEGWQRNLSETFGGRVSIDFDHSSDRGNGTRAAAWIPGLHQQGKLVTADVEWTPKGAKSVRNGDYRYISPTFVNDFKDEHGGSNGKALIGAALTNRPVLRKGMPTLSLSRDRFDGVATPRKAGKGKKGKGRVADAQKAAVAQAKRILKKSQSGRPPSPSHTPGASASSRPTKSGRLAGNPPSKKLAKMALAAGADPDEVRIMTAPGADADLQQLWLASLAPEDVHTLAVDDDEMRERAMLMAADDVDPQLRRVFLAQLAGTDVEPVTSSAPLGMDDDRYKLHTEAKQLAQTRCDANPRLDPGETYALAAVELEDRRFPNGLI